MGDDILYGRFDTTLLYIGKFNLVASPTITSTFEMLSLSSLLIKIAAILLSCSIAITFPAFFARGMVKVPIPAPISSTVSLIESSALWIICESTSVIYKIVLTLPFIEFYTLFI